MIIGKTIVRDWRQNDDYDSDCSNKFINNDMVGDHNTPLTMFIENNVVSDVVEIINHVSFFIFYKIYN